MESQLSFAPKISKKSLKVVKIGSFEVWSKSAQKSTFLKLKVESMGDDTLAASCKT